MSIYFVIGENNAATDWQEKYGPSEDAKRIWQVFLPDFCYCDKTHKSQSGKVRSLFTSQVTVRHQGMPRQDPKTGA